VRGRGALEAFSGAVLALLGWCWITLPFIRGGPTEVGHTLRAKFVNQAPDGSALP
jgi:hypothetical protein